jgi:hypothetical protein
VAALVPCSALLALVVAAPRLLGCEPSGTPVRAPTIASAERPPPATAEGDGDAAPSPGKDESPPAASLATAELVQSALGLSYAVERKDFDALARSDAGYAQRVVWALSFPSPPDGGFDMLSLVLYDGASAFEGLLEEMFPSHTMPDEMRRRIEASAIDVPIGRNRTARIKTMGMFLGGIMRWATIPSPHHRFELAVVAVVPLHDEPLTDAGRAAVDGIADDAGFARVLARLDAALWP